MIRTQRTAGGHRRIARSGLDEFLKLTASAEWKLGARPPTAAATHVAEAAETYQAAPSRAELVAHFQQGLLAGDEATCRAVAQAWSTRYKTLAQLGDGLITGAMDRIGQLRKLGRVEVFQERRSCEICARLVHQFRLKLAEPSPRAPRAIGGTLAGDHYALASQLVELVLREAGWNAMNLGGDLPYETLVAAARQERPRLLWLSISHIAEPELFVENYTRFYAELPTEVLVVVGGRALTDDLRPRIQYTAHVDKLEQLATLAQVISGVR